MHESDRNCVKPSLQAERFENDPDKRRYPVLFRLTLVPNFPYLNSNLKMPMKRKLSFTYFNELLKLIGTLI